MILEVVGFFGLLLTFLFALAEFGRKKVLGSFGAVVLVLLGLLLIADGIQIVVGVDTNETIAETHTFNLTGTLRGNATANSTGNYTDSNYTEGYLEDVNGTILRNTTITERIQYAEITMPYFPFNEFLGLICILLGLYGLAHYGSLKEG